MSEDEQYVRVGEVARQHSVHEDTVRRWIVVNNVPVRRIGNRIRIPISYAHKFGESSINEAKPLTMSPETASELLKMCKYVVDWFEAIETHQHDLLINGQSLESAFDKWDEATFITPLDIEPIRAAIKKAEHYS